MEMHRGEGHMISEAETGGTQPPAQERLEPPAGGGRKDPPLEPLEGARPCLHLDFGILGLPAVRE